MFNYSQCQFEKSAVSLATCPDSVKEVGFAGRSNAGKSSALNLLTHQKIAKTSKTPGRTQLLNFFALNDGRFLVDLPGYGYAKVSHSTQKQWQAFLQEYLFNRKELVGMVVVMDCRHPLQNIDVMMLDFCQDSGLESHVLLTKSDKLAKNKQIQVFKSTQKEISNTWERTSIQLFSATKKQGKSELVEVLNNWLS